MKKVFLLLCAVSLIESCSLFKREQVKPPQPPSISHYQNLEQRTFSTEGENTDPELSKDAKLLYYASTANSVSYDIYEKAIDGTTTRQITSDPADERFPTICPVDKNKIAFVSNKSGHWHICVINNFNKNPNEWIDISEQGAEDIHPSWSPDGTKIVYCSSIEQGIWKLVVYDLITNTRYKLPLEGFLPSWSPVDDRIVFQKTRERGKGFSQIWIVHFQDGEAKFPTEIVSSSEWAAINPSWSPDGKYLTFASVGKSKEHKDILDKGDDIWIVSSDGGTLTEITFDEPADWLPHWATDGRIYFVSNRLGSQNIWSLKPILKE